MPTGMRVETELTFIHLPSALHIATEAVYGCRDEWIDDIRIELVNEVTEAEVDKVYDDADLHIFIENFLSGSHVSARIRVRLLKLTDLEALRILDEVTRRYDHLNITGHYMIERIYDPFQDRTIHVMCFSGNEWTVAVAWWFMLVQRLYVLDKGENVLDTLERSDEYDDDCWYDSDDKDDHIALWNNGVDKEPNPTSWFIHQLGPISINYKEAEEAIL